jgi:hypothetical protein
VNRDYREFFRSAAKVLVILCLLAPFLMIAHKAFADITALAQQYSGGDFWTALLRHVLWSLAGR